jgi:hypothetical protein
MPSRKRDVRRDIASISAGIKSSAIAADRLVEQVTFSLGHVSVELRRVPAHLILPGWPIFQTADGEIQIGLPMVLAAYPGARHTGISGPELPQLIAEVRAALGISHPDLMRGRQ